MSDIALRDGGGDLAPLSLGALKAQVGLIQQVMKDVMHEGEHYGVVPGTEKPTLLKAGAEKLCFVFRLFPEYKVDKVDLPSGHREYDVTCSLRSPNGTLIAQGLGTCTSMESKYRWRADFEDTGEPIPEDSKERKQEYRNQGFGMKKIGGKWAWVKYLDGQRQENPDIADTFNTILKMAAKRAAVAATLSATAASDIFTQDMEEVDPGGEERSVGGNGNPKPGKAQSLGGRLTALMNGTALGESEKKELHDGYPKVADKAAYLDVWEKRAAKVPRGAGVPEEKIPL